MNNIILKNLGFIFIIVLFTACPYETKVPIDEPSVKATPALLGNWSDSKNNDTYKVSLKDEFTYMIEQTKKSLDKKDNLFAYISIVNGVKFLNLWSNTPKDSVKKYSLYKIELPPDGSINLSEVTENIDEQFSWSVDLKKFIIANMRNSYFYGKEEINLIRSNK